MIRSIIRLVCTAILMHMGVLRNLVSGFWYIFQEKRRWSQLLVFGPSFCLIQSLHYQHPSSSMPMQPHRARTGSRSPSAAGAALQPQHSRWTGSPHSLPPGRQGRLRSRSAAGGGAAPCRRDHPRRHSAGLAHPIWTYIYKSKSN